MVTPIQSFSSAVVGFPLAVNQVHGNFPADGSRDSRLQGFDFRTIPDQLPWEHLDGFDSFLTVTIASNGELRRQALSGDHSAAFTIKEGNPLFLSVQAGRTVIVLHLPAVAHPFEAEQWRMTDLIHVDGLYRFLQN